MKRKKQHNRSFKKVAKLITAAACMTPLALAVPALSEAQSAAAAPVVKQHIKDVIATQETAGKIRAGSNITIDLNNIFEEADQLTYTVAVQNGSVADAVITSSDLLNIRLKKQGTTMVDVSAKQPNESIALHERFQLTVGPNTELDLNGDGAGLDDVVKYFKAHPEDFHSIDDYRTVLGAAVESTVTEPNRPPASKGAAVNINAAVGEQVILNMNDYFSDEDGDALTYTLQALPSGDIPAGAVLDSSSGALTVTGLAASLQPLLITVVASDGQTGHSPATQLFNVSVMNSNHMPAASSGTLHAVEDVTAAGTLSAADADGDHLTYAIVSQAAKGIVTITGRETGAYTYTPDPNAFGTDSFTFMVNDGTANSAPSTVSVTITGVDDDPVVNPDFHVGLNNGGNISLGAYQKAQVDLSELFTDPDGDPLLFSTSLNDRHDLSGSLSASGLLTLQAGLPSGSIPSSSIELRASDDGGATWVTHTITATVLESRTSIPDQYIPADPTSVHSLSLSDYFDLGGNGKWSFSVVNKEGNGYASASVSGSTITIKGLETGISTLIVTLDDGHGGKISDEFKVVVGFAADDIGTQYMTNKDGIYTGMVYLDDIFPTASQFRVKTTGTAALNTVPAMLNENGEPNWFTSPYLYLSSEMEVDTTVTVEARNELGEIAQYTFPVKVNHSPQYIGDGEPIIIKKGQTYTLNLLSPTPMFEDPDGDEIGSYYGYSDGNIASIGPIANGQVPITGAGYGDTWINITASDGHGYGEAQIEVHVVDEAAAFAAGSLTASVDLNDILTDIPDPISVTHSSSSLILLSTITGTTLQLVANPVEQLPSIPSAGAETITFTITGFNGLNLVTKDVVIYVSIPETPV